MLTRMILILAFAMQPVGLLRATVQAGSAAQCRPLACDQVVEITTCCGEVVLQMVCEQTPQDCCCQAGPTDQDSPLPQPPATPPSAGETFFALPPRVIGSQDGPFGGVNPLGLWTSSRLGAHQSHNQRLALTCVWRT